MPSLPGGQPLTLTGGGKKAKAKTKVVSGGKGRGGNKDNKDNPDAVVTPPRKRKGDDQLLQLDLKRKQHVLAQNVATRLQ